MTQPIKLIVVDVDGTLLNSKQELTTRTEQVLRAALEKGVQIVLATGKTRASGQMIIDKLGLKTPGIYLQGLAIYSPDGSIHHQHTLDVDVARQVITFTEDRGFSMVAYSGPRILVRSLDPGSRELADKYHEPMPEAVGPLQNILGDMPINKLLAIKLGEPRRITALRWQLGMQIDGKAKLVQALEDMLEIVPPGTSKGAALRTVLRDMSILPEQVLAIGDGENDTEMIEMAGVGVAMGNSSPKLKETADFVSATNDEDGVAVAVEKFVLGTHEPASAARPAIQSNEVKPS